jgi:hypothetical protein
MATILKAGNVASGAQITSDSTGILEIKTGTGSGTTAVTIGTGQAVTFAGRTTNPTTISVGNATPATSGAGVTFPATQSASTDANTLDDYEEGTFTPTATGASTAGTTTYTVQAGFYTKIGRQVTVSIKLGYSAMTGTGTVNIGNLPFTSANTTSLETVGSVMTQNLNWTGGTYLSTYIDVNQAVLNVYGSTDDGALSAQQCVNETANYWIVHTYFTA